MSDPQIAADLLRQAADIVAGSRALAYGDPNDDFNCTAQMWSAYLHHRQHVTGKGASYALTPVDVAVMMLLVKISRLAKTPNHADSWRDIAGYAACGARVAGANVDDMPRPAPGAAGTIAWAATPLRDQPVVRAFDASLHREEPGQRESMWPRKTEVPFPPCPARHQYSGDNALVRWWEDVVGWGTLLARRRGLAATIVDAWGAFRAAVVHETAELDENEIAAVYGTVRIRLTTGLDPTDPSNDTAEG